MSARLPVRVSVLLIPFLVLAHIVPAGAFGGAPGFVVSPTEGGPFTVVAVSGSGCTEGPEPMVRGELFRPDTGKVVTFSAPAEQNGDWATTFTVPPSYPAGVYDVRASCDSEPGLGPTVFEYAPQTFTVLAGEAPTVTVSPLQAVAGQETVATVSGILCRGENASVRVALYRLPFENHDVVALEFPTPDAQGNWSAVLTLAASLPPQTYAFELSCDLGRSFFLYDAPDFVLTAPGTPPATPVSRQPTFTG